MYVSLTAIVYLLSKCSAIMLLGNTIRLVEKLPVALLWSLMKLLTCLTSKQEQQMWVYVCVRARACVQYEWMVKMKASLAMMRERQADSAVMVSGMGGGLSWLRHAVEAD